jgi:hypothetical protein
MKAKRYQFCMRQAPDEAELIEKLWPIIQKKLGMGKHTKSYIYRKCLLSHGPQWLAELTGKSANTEQKPETVQPEPPKRMIEVEQVPPDPVIITLKLTRYQTLQIQSVLHFASRYTELSADGMELFEELARMYLQVSKLLGEQKQKALEVADAH